MTVAMKSQLGAPVQLRPDATVAEFEMAQEYLARLEVMATAGHETLAEFVNANPAVVPAALLGFQPTLGSTEIPKAFQGTFRDRAVNVWRALSESLPAKAIAATAVAVGALALGFAAAGKTTTAPSGVAPVVMQPVFANSSFCPPAMTSMVPPAREGVGQLGMFEPSFMALAPEADESSFFKEGAANVSDCPAFEGAAASADNADVTFPEESYAMCPATNATEEAHRVVALTPQPPKNTGFFSFDHLNASFCPVPTEEGTPIALIDREVEGICPAANATYGILKEGAFVESEIKERSRLDIAKDIAMGVAIVGGVVLKGIAAATATAVGSIFVAGTLME